MKKDHIKIIQSLVKRITGRSKGFDYDDYYQIGCMAYLKAKKSYRKKMKIKFTTWLHIKVRYALLDAVGKVDTLSLCDKMFDVCDLRTAESYYLGYESVDQWIDLIHQLRPSHKVILMKLFFDGVTQLQIAKRHNMDPAKVCLLRNEALAELKKLYLERQGTRKRPGIVSRAYKV